MISDMYFIQKKVLIEELVEHDEEMIKKGEVMIDNDTGETTILSNKKQRQEEINELKSNLNIDRNQIIEIMDAESSINSNERKSVADRSSYVSSYQEQYNEENNRIKNEERNTENKTQQLPQPFQNANKLVKDEYLKNNDQREQYSIKVKQEMNDKSDGKKPKSTIISYCEMTQNTQLTNNGEEEKNLQSIRIRFQFKSENIVAGATYSEQMKQVLYDVISKSMIFLLGISAMPTG